MSNRWYQTAESKKRKAEAVAGQSFMFGQSVQRTDSSSGLEVRAVQAVQVPQPVQMHKKPRHKKVHILTYMDFLREHEELGIPKDPFVQEAQKRELLVRYFDYRFGDKGTQPISGYTKKGQVGAIYQGVWAQAMKIRKGR